MPVQTGVSMKTCTRINLQTDIYDLLNKQNVPNVFSWRYSKSFSNKFRLIFPLHLLALSIIAAFLVCNFWQKLKEINFISILCRGCILTRRFVFSFFFCLMFLKKRGTCWKESAQTQMKGIHSHGQRQSYVGLEWMFCSSNWIHSQSDTRISDVLSFQSTILVFFSPHLSLNLLFRKIHSGCRWRPAHPCSPVTPNTHPHHASPYFSGALRWKSISFAKQSGRLPQHRGVMESDGWPPYQEPWDKA